MEGTSPKGVEWYGSIGGGIWRKLGNLGHELLCCNLRHDPEWGWLAELTPPCIPSTLTHQDLGALVDGAIELHANPAYRMDAQRRAT